ncbi:HsdM family class I SAM-dependent methyltransferase [Pseudomonas lactucae]|uniref:site-specific DNA-methyltransferase (adenine-specific) n=1 Tax=Pseudomonas lactucae TaxID=2813360 RepID=A0A9X0YC06_9PSED|nr:N-6 DNA methylase [Pseudomonas lactucae]MBN2976397.1 N-6 DNA methylase [Pseudomonas lactucae]MBN2987388.1 N-6 DNA methylase [Pseudomonas lactucae]
MDNLQDWLAKAGVTSESTVDLGGISGPRHVRYLDLLPSGDNQELLPDAVVESGGVPLIYVVRHDTLGSERANTAELSQLVRVLACRADARYLAVVEPGKVVVYPILMDEVLPVPVLSDTEEGGYAKFRGILSGSSTDITSTASTRKSRKAAGLWLDGLLFRLLTDAARDIHRCAPLLTVQQVLSLVGRALFFRFLVDRHIVSEAELPCISHRTSDLSMVFSNLDALIETCTWLDKTFNGDLLSLTDSHDAVDKYIGLRQLLDAGAETICWHLTNIQCKAVHGQLPLQWGGIYFRHVPVDVLSQVYEDFAHQFIPELARETSIHFTPRKLAEIVVDGAFSAVSSTTPDRARVLDPSVGGGVFLVLAFKRLIAERWRASGKRPCRTEIRLILMEQITGLDVNHDALNITALSLYLCALELDPDPRPLSELKFKKLVGSILHPVDESSLDPAKVPYDSPHDMKLGSLSSEVLHRHAGLYDIVVGNPPWNAFKDDRAGALNRTLRKLLAKPNQSTPVTASDMVARYGSPDIAFLLAASSWAKPAGAIGFAVHGRFLFQGDSFELRRHVFENLRVTGVMNFAALRQDQKIWPKNDAQFALMVATNETPDPLDGFFFISPRHEPRLSQEGVFRIDPNSAIPVSLFQVCNDPQAFKALYKGGRLGLDLLHRMRSETAQSLGEQVAKHGGSFNSGYQTGKEEKRQTDASHLVGLLDVQHDMTFVVAPGSRTAGEQDRYFELPKLQWPRTPEIYRGPLLLLRESPKPEREFRGALFSATDAAYRESFIGLSALGKPELNGLIDLIYVVSYSDLFLYHQLLTSPKFGVERDSSLQKDLLDFPLVREETLTVEQWQKLRVVAGKLRNRCVKWQELDELVFDLHGLSTADRQLVRDTLKMDLPFTDVSKQATTPTCAATRQQFVDTVAKLIHPFVDSDQAGVSELQARPIDGWVFIEVGAPENSPHEGVVVHDLAHLVTFADSYWSSRIQIKLKDRTVFGQLDQMRYWTLTEARSLTLDWLQSGEMPGTGDAPFIRGQTGVSSP